jgi:hypothetical protein
MMTAATMAVAMAAVATRMAAALTSGGDCGSCGIGEAESSKGWRVLHLQTLGGSVGCGLVDKPMEEGAGEGEGADCCHHHGFDGGGHGLLPSLLTLSSPTSMMTTMTTTTMTTTTTTTMMTTMTTTTMTMRVPS